MATRNFKFSDETLDQRLAEARNIANQREVDYFRLAQLTPSDLVDQSGVDAARAEAERVRKVADDLQAEVDKRNDAE